MGLDQLVALVDLLKEPDAEPVDCNSVLEGIRRLLQSAGVERKQTSQADAERTLAASLEEADPKSLSEETRDTASSPSPPVPDPLEGVHDEDDVPPQYLPIFVDETQLSLDDLTGTLLALEGGGNREELKTLLVTAHKIKGSAASIGLNRAAKLAHLMEDLLQNLVATGGALSAEITDVMLKCIDALRQYTKGLREGAGPSDQFGQLARELLAAESASSKANASSAENASPDTAAERTRLEPVDRSAKGWIRTASCTSVWRRDSLPKPTPTRWRRTRSTR